MMVRVRASPPVLIIDGRQTNGVGHARKAATNGSPDFWPRCLGRGSLPDRPAHTGFRQGERRGKAGEKATAP